MSKNCGYFKVRQKPFKFMTSSSIPVKKVIVVGDSAVGKTSLLLNYVDGVSAKSTNTTVGVDFKNKLLDVNGESIKLQLWDTAGQERFRTIALSYFRKADGIALIFDVTSSNSFEHIPYWMDNIVEKTDHKLPIILIGNKGDLPDAITADQAKKMADDYRVPFFKTSAKTGDGISEAFMKLAQMILEDDSKEQETSEPKSVDLTSNSQHEDEKKACC